MSARIPVPALIPTTVVGSYPQPDWLVDRESLRSRLPPRVRARFFVGRVATNLLRRAAIPLLLVPPAVALAGHTGIPVPTTKVGCFSPSRSEGLAEF